MRVYNSIEVYLKDYFLNKERVFLFGLSSCIISLLLDTTKFSSVISLSFLKLIDKNISSVLLLNINSFKSSNDFGPFTWIKKD